MTDGPFLHPEQPPSEAKMIALATRYYYRGFYQVPWTVNGPATDTYKGYPPRTLQYIIDLIRQKACKRLAGRPTPEYVFLDCDKDWRRGARAVYDVLGLERGLEYRSPNGLYIVVERPVGAPIHHGTNRHEGIGLKNVDIFTSESVPVTLPGSWKPARGNKKGGHYYVTHRPEKLPTLSERALELLKPPPKREPDPVRPYIGDVHPVAQDILDQDLEILANEKDGNRGEALRAIAANLGGLVGGGQLPEAGLADLIYAAAAKNGMTSKEEGACGPQNTKRTIRNALAWGKVNKVRNLEGYKRNYDAAREAEKRRAVVQNNPVGAGSNGEGPKVG